MSPPSHDPNTRAEQGRLERRALIFSAVGALFMAATGIGFFLLTSSQAILLDGLFSLVGFATGLVSLRVARVVQQPDDKHFQFGYGSLEPLFNLVKGATIAAVGIFALVDSVNALLHDGRPIETGYALIYACIVGILCFVVAAVQHHTARRISSPLVEIDVKNWLVDGFLTIAVLVAFAIAYFLQDTEYQWLVAYVDPGAVALLVLLSAPLPFSIIRDSLAELALAAPDASIQSRAHELLAPELATLEADYHVRMVKVGRSLYLNIYVLLRDEHAATGIAQQDEVRERVVDALSSEFPNVTADLAFTLDRRWIGNVA